MLVLEIEDNINKNLYRKVEDEDDYIKDLFNLRDLWEIKSDYKIEDYILLYQLSSNVWVLTDKNNNYLSLIKTFCKDEDCLCHRSYLSNVNHTLKYKILSDLWENNKECYAEENPFKEINKLTEIKL